jgi:cysteine-rich repeat protein
MAIGKNVVSTLPAESQRSNARASRQVSTGLDKHKAWLIGGIALFILAVAISAFVFLQDDQAIAGQAYFRATDGSTQLVPDFDLGIECLDNSNAPQPAVWVPDGATVLAGQTVACRLALTNIRNSPDNPNAPSAALENLPVNSLFGTQFTLLSRDNAGTAGGFVAIENFQLATNRQLPANDRLLGGVESSTPSAGIGQTLVLYKPTRIQAATDFAYGLPRRTAVGSIFQEPGRVILATFDLRAPGMAQLPGSGTPTGSQPATYTLNLENLLIAARGNRASVTVNPTTEICTNGQDEDGDGAIDCADADCRGRSGPGEARCCLYDDPGDGSNTPTTPSPNDPTDWAQWQTYCTSSFVCTPTNQCALSSTCGDSITSPNEGCDDANTIPGDGCSATCTIEPGFSCSGTPSTCSNTCGDGIRAGTEACDDANTVSGDGCNSCAVEPGYTCNQNIGQTRTDGMCTTTCGDRVIAGLEACDDGNTAPNDGCSAACSVEDGFTCAGTPSTCSTICGDGVIAGNEICDDGNTDAGDGCSANCLTVEPGYACTAQPSVCTIQACGNGAINPTAGCTNCGPGAFMGIDNQCRRVGDVINDGGWNSRDAIAASNHILRQTLLNGDDLRAANADCSIDPNGNLIINIEDVLTIADAIGHQNPALLCTPS